jgi:outer membrane protein
MINGAVSMNKYLLFFLLIVQAAVYGQQKNIVYLSWNDVIGKSLEQNIALQSRLLEYEAQDLEVWRSYSNLLPTLRYQGVAVNNLELPVIVFMGQQFIMGTNYTFQHSLDLTLPIFTGGSRFFNIKTQNSLRKSLSEELKGEQEETVLEALQAYFGIILADSLVNSAREAVEVAEANLRQVEFFYNEGTATQLDLLRARAQYYSVLPGFENAESNKLLSQQRLKMLLDMPLEDSLVVTDSLSQKDFLSTLKEADLIEYKNISLESRSELKALNYRLDAVSQGENLALSQFAPVLAVSGSLQYQAFSDNARISWNDYTRSKAISLSLTWPLFDGGRRIIDYQLAKIRTDQTELLLRQSRTGITLEVEQNFYRFNETVKTLRSLEEAMKQSRESLRLSNLLYAEGMSTQLEVLNAQLLYNNSLAQYLQGIYNYNINQLTLLRSIGKLNTIWN